MNRHAVTDTAPHDVALLVATDSTNDIILRVRFGYKPKRSASQDGAVGANEIGKSVLCFSSSLSTESTPIWASPGRTALAEALSPPGEAVFMANKESATDNLKLALKYAKYGWHVIPLNGKKPRSEHGYKDGTTDPEQIRAWWEQWPDADIGIATGATSGIVVLDVDPRNGGLDSLAELETRFGKLPRTVTVRSGGSDGGKHFYFGFPHGMAIASKKGKGAIAPGLDLLSDGSYVAAPPTVHPDSGKRYAWQGDPYDTPLYPLPEWLASATHEEPDEPTDPASDKLLYETLYRKHVKGLQPPRADGEAKGVCPFHEDDDPSLSVNLRTGLWYCHACDEGGTAYLFVQKAKIPATELPALPDDASGGKKSQATTLAQMAAGLELYHQGDEGYAAITKNGHTENWPIRSKGFRLWLSKQYYDREHRVPGAQALQDALTILDGDAFHAGPEHPVHLRLAERKGAIYLDLGDPEWRAVKITKDGWSVVSNPRVKFRRTKGMLALPKPVEGGSIEELRDFVNVADRDWPLFLAALIAAFRPRGPYPVLAQHGEQGSGKSINSRVFRAMIDPHRAPLRSEPRDARDLMVSAVNGWVLAFDNLSYIHPWLSDALCRLSTGDGYSTRELYSNSEEIIFEAQRPIILNGIEELATRADLLDRALVIYLPLMDGSKRLAEDEFLAKFEEARPRILGAILDAVSAALRNLPKVKLRDTPRMADFAKWMSAAEKGLGWEPGTFMAAYAKNRRSANLLALEASPVASAVRQFIKENRQWEGSAADLLKKLNAIDPDRERKKGWPGNPAWLAGNLRRLAPSLRGNGVSIRFKHGKHRVIILEWLDKSASPATAETEAAWGSDDATDAKKARHSKRFKLRLKKPRHE